MAKKLTNMHAEVQFLTEKDFYLYFVFDHGQTVESNIFHTGDTPESVKKELLVLAERIGCLSQGNEPRKLTKEINQMRNIYDKR